VEARHLTRLSRALRTSGVNGVAAAFRGEAVFASGCSVLDRGYITVRPLYSAKTTMVSAFSENRAVRTSEVQDPETDFGQHCTVAITIGFRFLRQLYSRRTVYTIGVLPYMC
jgi:hypothetical protein